MKKILEELAVYAAKLSLNLSEQADIFKHTPMYYGKAIRNELPSSPVTADYLNKRLTLFHDFLKEKSEDSKLIEQLSRQAHEDDFYKYKERKRQLINTLGKEFDQFTLRGNDAK